MKQQNYSSHKRYVPAWHFVTSTMLLALLIGSIVNLANSAHENLYSASLLVLVAVILAFIFAYARLFALKAQDRAIRAEESLRYYILTGKRLPQQLRMGQVIALRFASDEELPVLVERALQEKLRGQQIKQAIQNWRADHHRV
jgi:uncharacterized protein (DUF58 family)